MRQLLILSVICVGLLLPAAGPSQAELLKGKMKLITETSVQTARLGGVDVPPADVLVKMHKNQYILRAAGGKLTKVPVERNLLPHSDGMSPQSTQVDLGPEGVVYVRQSEKLCKSTDGGRTWTVLPFAAPPGFSMDDTGRWKVLRDGTFICVAMKNHDAKGPAVVWTSRDEGQTWKKRSEIELDMKLPQTDKPYVFRYCHRGLDRLQDDTLLWAPDVRDDPYTLGHALYYFRSTDSGKTWSEPAVWIDWGSEGAATRLPSGKVLCVIRYQREADDDDGPEIRKAMGAYASRPEKIGFKNVFLMDSHDGGQTWSTPRMLTTAFGQTFGYPAAQGDGTVVVVHDTRYGPGPAGARAMISRDEGQTWLDEVYYLDHSVFVGSYSASVVFEDDTILTISGSSQAGNDWNAVSNQTDLYAIRWKPVKD